MGKSFLMKNQSVISGLADYKNQRYDIQEMSRAAGKNSIKRAKYRTRIVEPNSDIDSDREEEFVAKPAGELPKNKLVDKLAKGLTIFVQRMIKRSSYHVSIKRVNTELWKPPPRENAQLVCHNNGVFLIGGMNHNTVSELSYLHLKNGDRADLDILEPLWSKLEVSYPQITSDIPVVPTPTFGHSSTVYKDKIISFGGSQAYDLKQNLRECTNQVSIFHPITNVYERVVTSGHQVGPRRHHLATVFGKQMVVLGGQLQSDKFVNDAFVLDLETLEWRIL